MKKLITAYTFDASAQTVTLTGLTSATLENVLLITNVTDGIIIYNFAEAAKGATIASGVLTLDYDTTSMDDADRLQIWYDDGVATVAVTQSGTWDEVGINDSGNSITVDGTVAVTGVATAANQTTVIGHLDGVEGLLTTIDADTGTLAGAVAGTEVQVDIVSSALPSGASTSAKQDTIIGHVDGIEALLTTIDADTSNLSVVGGGTEATALRVTIANNSTGVLSIDDNGGAITVDGTVTAELSATDNAVLDNIDADLTTLIGHADGIEGILTTIDADTGNIVTSVQTLDDLVLAEDAAHTTGDKGIMALAVRQDTQADLGADGDYVPLSIDENGALRVSGGGGGTQYNVDGALGSTPTGNVLLAKRDDALSALTPVEGDAIELRVDANGALWVTLGTKLDKDNDSILMYANTVKDGSGTDYVPLVDADGHLQLDVLSNALPTGAATSAKQDTVIGHLDGVETTLTTISTNTTPISGIGHGVKTVTTAGTDVVLAASTACKRVTVQAQTDNTGLIAVGGTGVDATEATGTGIILYAGDVYEFEIDNLADVFIDSTVNGEGVRYTYFS